MPRRTQLRASTAAQRSRATSTGSGDDISADPPGTGSRSDVRPQTCRDEEVAAALDQIDAVLQDGTTQ